MIDYDLIEEVIADLEDTYQTLLGTEDPPTWVLTDLAKIIEKLRECQY